ncbi:hypothetical protein B0H10DRAFT_1969780 [Mycena sp. CBHHK59/15]|nr:hypothetical protein B0H10DRAFT_1969780 [Mycena sp. CBHHK59/15]
MRVTDSAPTICPVWVYLPALGTQPRCCGWPVVNTAASCWGVWAATRSAGDGHAAVAWVGGEQRAAWTAQPGMGTVWAAEEVWARGGCGEQRVVWRAEGGVDSAGEVQVWRGQQRQRGRSAGVANGGRPGQRGRGTVSGGQRGEWVKRGCGERRAAWTVQARRGCGVGSRGSAGAGWVWRAEGGMASRACGRVWRAEDGVGSAGEAQVWRVWRAEGGMASRDPTWKAAIQVSIRPCGRAQVRKEGVHACRPSTWRKSWAHAEDVGARWAQARCGRGVGKQRAVWASGGQRGQRRRRVGGCGKQRTTCERTALGGGLCRGWGSEQSSCSESSETGLSQSMGMEVSTSAPWADLQLNHPAPLPTRPNPLTTQNGAADPPCRSGTMLSTERWGLGHGECCGKSSEMTNAEIAEVAAPQRQHAIVAKIRRRRLCPGPDAARESHH